MIARYFSVFLAWETRILTLLDEPLVFRDPVSRYRSADPRTFSTLSETDAVICITRSLSALTPKFSVGISAAQRQSGSSVEPGSSRRSNFDMTPPCPWESVCLSMLVAK